MSDVVTHRGEEIRIALLAEPPYWTITAHIFTRCRIIGPAVLACGAVHDHDLVVIEQGHAQFRDCTFRGAGDAASVLWAKPPAGVQLVGAINLEDCLFERCTFNWVALLAAEFDAGPG